MEIQVVELFLGCIGYNHRFLFNDDYVIWLASMKVREILKRPHDDGWYHVVTRGSHRQFKHPTKPGRVTVAGMPNEDIAPGTLNSILKQAGLKS
jgi:predicted RNA binding protein YcfA (HicA-like mRNA interferase family)